jgi:hypothetical protein
MDPEFGATAKRRGRPSKFGRPSRVVALTLPEDALDRLRRIHRDLGWAILKLLDKEPRRVSTRDDGSQPDVELVTVADRRSLIVVNREVIKNLPGVNIIPFSGNRAFLALDIDRGMSDLELAVSDRLGEATVERVERRALTALRARLTTWRRDHGLQFHTRAIIVVERRLKKSSERDTRAAARGLAARRTTAKVAAGTPSGPPVGGLKAGCPGAENLSRRDDRPPRAGESTVGVSTNEISYLDLRESN